MPPNQVQNEGVRRLDGKDWISTALPKMASKATRREIELPKEQTTNGHPFTAVGEFEVRPSQPQRGFVCVCVFFFLRSFSERVWRAPISTNLVIGPVLYWENLCPLPVLSASSTRGKVC